MLRPAGRPVAERQLDRAGLLQVLEVAPRGAAADPGLLGDVDRGDAGCGSADRVEHESECGRGDALREPAAALRAKQREQMVDIVLVRFPETVEAPPQSGVALESVAKG